MSRGFLFAEDIQDDRAPCLLLSDELAILEPLQTRSFEAYRNLVGEEESIIVLPAHWVSIHPVDVPKISSSKMRQAIPFMLEEMIAQPIEAVHFAYPPMSLQKGRFEVIAIDKNKLKALLALLEEHHVPFHAITIDWCALAHDTMALCEERALFRSALYNGALLDKSTCPSMMQALDWTILSFTDETQKRQWIAEQLSPRNIINLCQGEFKPKLISQGYKRWYQLALITAVVWLGLFIFAKGSEIALLNHRLEEVNERVLASYQKFFPNATQVINPRFRIGSLLKGDDTGTNETLWKLLTGLAKDFNPKLFNLIEMKWRAPALTITFETKEFSQLERLENRLSKGGLKVKQLQAKTENNSIQATLELTC